MSRNREPGTAKTQKRRERKERKKKKKTKKKHTFGMRNMGTNRLWFDVSPHRARFRPLWSCGGQRRDDQRM